MPADEPTTALDVTIQAQVLGLLADLRAKHGMAVLFITRNLGVVAQIADRVAVKYAGEIVEQGPVDTIFARPLHHYTRALFAAVPRIDVAGQALSAIGGRVPAVDAMPAGCRFAPRCPLARAACEQPQALAEAAPGHAARCSLPFLWQFEPFVLGPQVTLRDSAVNMIPRKRLIIRLLTVREKRRVHFCFLKRLGPQV